MPVCPHCDARNPDEFRFCGQCGNSLGTTTCAACGASNPEGQAFCGQCGTRLGAPVAVAPPPTVEERKLATVLFADVVGFTSLAERTDPEVVARMVDAAFVELGRVVEEHGGTIDKYMGDSVMAVFGVPVAHDDDAERAVAAGLAMRRLGGDLVFSIGINSGEVMVSALGGGDATVIGDTVNVAARLEKAAAPGEVLCGRLTAELARRRVEFRERQPVLLKGKSEPVEVWEAVRLRRVADAPTAEDGTLVGRQDELAFLEMQWRRVHRDGEAKLVVLCGDAGSGKTRLLDELATEVGCDGLVVRADYPAYGAFGGLRVAAALVEQLGHSDQPDVEARVRSMLGELDPSLAGMDPDAMQAEQVWAVARLLKERAADRPLVIILDDLHWGDDRTLELVGEIAARMRDVPILTVVAGRTDPGGWLGRFTSATTLRLTPLSRADAGALAESFVGDKALAPEARQFLVDMTNGNPLYLRELVAMARARNMLVDDGDCYRITAHSGIPATLQALLAARLDALERGQKQLLQHLALLGEASEVELTALGAPNARAQLAALAAEGLVRQTPGGRYEVCDPLLREVAYDMLPRNVRGDLHRRAARVGPEEDRVRHLERAAEYLSDDAELAAEAAEALALEGEALCAAFRPVDALHALEKAVALGLRRPDVLLLLARVQAGCGQVEEASATLALVPDDPDDPALAVERDHQAANFRVFSDPAQALPGLEEAVARWRALGDTGKEAWAHANAGVAHFYLSQMEESAVELERGLELFESIGDRPGAVAAGSFLGLARPADPRVDVWLADALAFAAETGDRSRQVTTLATLSWKHFFRSFCGSAVDMAEAEGFAGRMAAVATDLSIPDMTLHGHSLMAIMARLTGRFDDATARVAALQRLLASARMHEPWLAWATSFCVALATGATGAAPPFPPPDSLDPVTTMAGLVVNMELVLAGRLDEAIEHLELTGPPSLEGPMADVGGLVYGAALVLVGRAEEATPWIARAAAAAQLLQGSPAALAAAGLLAEATGDISRLPRPPVQAAGVAEALVARAHARVGDADAADTLRRAAKSLAAPGLLLGVHS